MDNDAGPLKANGERCKTSAECDSHNCFDTGDGLTCFGTLRGDEPCEEDRDCRTGFCFPPNPDEPGKVCVESDIACYNAGIDDCHLDLAYRFCQLHQKCTDIPEKFDKCVLSECKSLSSSVPATECPGLLETLKKDPSCPKVK